MLAAEHYPYYDGAMPNHELLEIHRSKISLRRAKTDYSYPTIRLPHTFSALAGCRPASIRPVHDGALAFLVVVAPSNLASENALESLKSPALT